MRMNIQSGGLYRVQGWSHSVVGTLFSLLSLCYLLPRSLAMAMAMARLLAMAPHIQSLRPVRLAKFRFTPTSITVLKATTTFDLCIHVESPAFFQIYLHLRYAFGSFQTPCSQFHFSCSVIVGSESLVSILRVTILGYGAQ